MNNSCPGRSHRCLSIMWILAELNISAVYTALHRSRQLKRPSNNTPLSAIS
ncbi:hypothetical protein ACTXT7_015101 [Hymenolepis weldensis]